MRGMSYDYDDDGDNGIGESHKLEAKLLAWDCNFWGSNKITDWL